MAAQELDKLWDASMASMTDSFARTQALLDEGKTGDAAREYRVKFEQTVKKLYSEAASVYPLRFSKAKNWCDWTKALYKSTVETDKALADGKPGEARDLLGGIREQFYQLHQDADIRASGDFIYAFMRAAEQDKPSVGDLKDLRKGLEEAPLSRQAAAAKSAYDQARREWAAAVDPILADGAVKKDELKPLRQASERFYQAFGMDFDSVNPSPARAKNKAAAEDESDES